MANTLLQNCRVLGTASPPVREPGLLALCRRLDYDPDQPREENGQWSSGAGSASGHSAAVRGRMTQVKAEQSARLSNKPQLAKDRHEQTFKAAEDVRGILDTIDSEDSQNRVLDAAWNGDTDGLSPAETAAAKQVIARIKSARSAIGPDAWDKGTYEDRILNQLASGHVETATEAHARFRSPVDAHKAYQEHVTSTDAHIAKVKAERAELLKNKPQLAKDRHEQTFNAAEDVRATLRQSAEGEKGWGRENETRVLNAVWSESRGGLSRAESIAADRIAGRMKALESQVGKDAWEHGNFDDKVLNEIVTGRIQSRATARQGFRDWQTEVRKAGSRG